VQVESKHAGERFGHWDRLSAKDIRNSCGVRTMAVVFSAAIRMSGWAYSSINVDGHGGGVVSGGGGDARWTRRCSTMRSPPRTRSPSSQCACFRKRVGRRSLREGAPAGAPTTWLPSVHDGAVKCGLGIRRYFPA
jgi:hypothetical protein